MFSSSKEKKSFQLVKDFSNILRTLQVVQGTNGLARNQKANSLFNTTKREDCFLKEDRVMEIGIEFFANILNGKESFINSG